MRENTKDVGVLRTLIDWTVERSGCVFVRAEGRIVCAWDAYDGEGTDQYAEFLKKKSSASEEREVIETFVQGATYRCVSIRRPGFQVLEQRTFSTLRYGRTQQIDGSNFFSMTKLITGSFVTALLCSSLSGCSRGDNNGSYCSR